MLKSIDHTQGKIHIFLQSEGFINISMFTELSCKQDISLSYFSSKLFSIT